jgi:hypothetical protein
MDCVVCATSLFHVSHEPMSMGCKCQEKLCQRCFKAGDVRKCPTCRRGKSNPKVDRKWLRRKWKLGTTEACLGCAKEVATRFLHKHETKCIRFRDLMDSWMEEDARMRRLQAEANQVAASEMEARIEIQAEVMDQMETQIDELESVVRQQEEERRSYCTEQARLLRTLDSLTGPLYNSIRRLDTLYTKISSARAALRSAGARHDRLRRRVIETATQVPLPSEANEPGMSREPPPPPYRSPRQNLHHRLVTVETGQSYGNDDRLENTSAGISSH